jgi:hypothetical protein
VENERTQPVDLPKYFTIAYLDSGGLGGVGVEWHYPVLLYLLAKAEEKEKEKGWKEQEATRDKERNRKRLGKEKKE